MSLQTRLASLITAIGSDVKALNLALNNRPAVIERNETTGTWPTRATVTTNPQIVVMWIGSTAPPTSAGYAISGKDISFLRVP